MVGKINNWFNLSISENESLQRELDSWNSKDITKLPPLVIETVLDLTHLDSQLKIDDKIINVHKKSEIVLERWLIRLDLDDYDTEMLQLPLIYKRIIIMFRSLCMILNLLPASKLLNPDKDLGGALIKIKILNGSKAISSKGRIGLSRPLFTEDKTHIIKSKDLKSVITPIGSLNLSVSYRQNCNFNVTSIDKPKVESTNIVKEKSNSIIYDNEDIKHSIHTADMAPPSEIHSEVYRSSFSSTKSRRRSSIRSGSIFKTGSIASSSPPISHAAVVLNSSNQQYVAPIPLSRNGSASSFSKFGKDISTSADSVSESYNPHLAITSRYQSSFGSKFGKVGSTHGSIDERMGNIVSVSSNNPILENFKAKHKVLSTTSFDSDPSLSLMIDDDLNGFMKLLDSKPDIRFNSSIFREGSPSSKIEDTLKNYENLRNVDFLKELSPTCDAFRTNSNVPPPSVFGDRSISDSVVRLLRKSPSPSPSPGSISVPIPAPERCKSSSPNISPNASPSPSPLNKSKTLSRHPSLYQQQSSHIQPSQMYVSQSQPIPTAYNPHNVLYNDVRFSYTSRRSRGSRGSHSSKGSISNVSPNFNVNGALKASAVSSYTPIGAFGSVNAISTNASGALMRRLSTSSSNGESLMQRLRHGSNSSVNLNTFDRDRDREHLALSYHSILSVNKNTQNSSNNQVIPYRDTLELIGNEKIVEQHDEITGTSPTIASGTLYTNDQQSSTHSASNKHLRQVFTNVLSGHVSSSNGMSGNSSNSGGRSGSKSRRGTGESGLLSGLGNYVFGSSASRRNSAAAELLRSQIGSNHHSRVGSFGSNGNVSVALSHPESHLQAKTEGENSGDLIGKFTHDELKAMSYGRGVFDDDSDDEHEHDHDHDHHSGEYNYNKPTMANPIQKRMSLSAAPVSGISGVQVRSDRSGAVEEEEELVFEMSDMALLKH
ncbi:serine/threonine protein kinase regulatory subunit [Martiniozyma asiatica (nom. inval.)]|nr:serine/threonine protein kinase regulatory subunit [Martiniozyma asiatica]